jgi:hypothetical protein
LEPEILDTFKLYLGCWNALKDDRKEIKLSPGEFQHHFYRFDYKITADLGSIPMRRWVSDEADYKGFAPGLKALSLVLYENSLEYKGVTFDGEYHAKGKRIARITATNFEALGEPGYALSLKLSQPDRYMDAIRALPGTLREPFLKNYCNHCNFQGATPQYCKFRLKWAYEGTPREGCAYQCFFFTDFDAARAPDYWRLLELEYGLKKG